MIVFLLTIYIVGSFNYILTYTAHVLHHLVTNTLHQHFQHKHEHYSMHSHFSNDHHHDHKHSQTLDFAIRKVSNDKENKEHPVTPFNRLEVKFSVHYLTSLTRIANKDVDSEGIKHHYIVNYKSPFVYPPVPPPRLNAS